MTANDVLILCAFGAGVGFGIMLTVIGIDRAVQMKALHTVTIALTSEQIRTLATTPYQVLPPPPDGQQYRILGLDGMELTYQIEEAVQRKAR